MNIDLTRYVIASGSFGPWLKDKDAFTADELRLGDPFDGVTLAGPLRICVAVQARNQLTQFGSSTVALQRRDVYSYVLDIPPGQTWSYPAPSVLGTAPGTSAAINEVVFGTNAGFAIAIRAAGVDLCDPCPPDPCRSKDPCAPKYGGCHCGGRCGSDCRCSCHRHPDEVPCDFATGSGANVGGFFPSACEPCAPGAFVGVPPVKGPSLLVPAARGGTVRTQYFNGMFITKEDLRTDQNNNRIKHSLMNRAMGQGVVWGLNVGLDGGTVVVCPGYGVDCCGNDIVITSPYRVDADALLRDPAATRNSFSTRHALRFNLLLEYYECPEDPRPVHGDPCAPDSVSCEMSRVRETARLRLIPPCDVKDDGPIKDFLDEIQQLKGDPVVGPILSGAHAAAAAAIAPQVPFTVLVEGLDASGVVGSVTLTPKLATDPLPNVTGDAKGVPTRSLMKRARVTITAQTGFQLISGDAIKQSPAGPLTPSKTATSISWEDDLPGPITNAPPLQYLFGNWTFQSSDGTLSSNGTPIVLTIIPAEGLRMALHVEVDGSQVDASSTQPPPFPCSAEACDPEGRPRFPVPIPWLHQDPGKPGEAADPKVIVLAILYAVVVSRIAQAGPNADVQDGMQKLANALNLAAWRLFYDKVPADGRANLLDALRRLFQAWCKALLYPGPTCECGCDPHGVIIGCAVVDGGRLRMVDPWGGRRWVVHYPLLAYWGKQFGIQPFDAIASKLFDLICCIAQLVPASGTVPPTGLAAARTPIVSLGASAIVFDQPSNIATRVRELGVVVDRRVTIGPAEFIAHVVAALNARPAIAGPATRTVLYTVDGVPELNFVTPDLEPPPQQPAPRPAPAAPDTGIGGSRVAIIVRSAIASRPARSAVPPLLRGMAESLTRDLLSGIVPEPKTDEARAARDTLAAAQIANVADLLNADPEHLHATVMNGQHAGGLADLLDAAEKRVHATAKAVGDTIVQFATNKRIAARGDLADPELASEFSKALVTALKGSVSADYLAAAVDRAAYPVQ